jgi:hypothetical protein
MIGAGGGTMTSAAYPWAERLAERCGHLAPQALIVAIMGVILLRMRPPADPALALSASVALIAFVVASALLMRRHDRSLCEHCVASMPLNPSELAMRYHRRFWLSHDGAQPGYVIPYFLVLIGSNFLPGRAGLLIWALVQTTMIYLILGYSTHRRLQPWCPWCRDNGGGTDKHEPATPDPLPSDHRQLA